MEIYDEGLVPDLRLARLAKRARKLFRPDSGMRAAPGTVRFAAAVMAKLDAPYPDLDGPDLAQIETFASARPDPAWEAFALSVREYRDRLPDGDGVSAETAMRHSRGVLGRERNMLANADVPFMLAYARLRDRGGRHGSLRGSGPGCGRHLPRGTGQADARLGGRGRPRKPAGFPVLPQAAAGKVNRTCGGPGCPGGPASSPATVVPRRSF